MKQEKEIGGSGRNDQRGHSGWESAMDSQWQIRVQFISRRKVYAERHSLPFTGIEMST